jgi:hypothetical protein
MKACLARWPIAAGLTLLLCGCAAGSEDAQPVYTPAEEESIDSGDGSWTNDTNAEGPGESGPCTFPGTKYCPGAGCVAIQDPKYGCSSTGCDPCPQAHGTSTCNGAACKLGACDIGYGDCNTNPSDGCEQKLDTDQNCGVCGNSCVIAHGMGACSAGKCAVTQCDSGYDDCDKDASNGCEQSLDTVDHCGACATPCAIPNGVGDCSTGQCQPRGCKTGFADCDHNPANGCETATTTISNCGECGKSCSLPNGTGDCSTGTCRLSSCNTAFGNCDSNETNGCEKLLRTLDDCGACGQKCTLANGTCVTGVCKTNVCGSGMADCNSDGTCETNLTTLTDCQACGIGCARDHATASCSSGQCKVGSCTGSWQDCDGVDGNGCEGNTASSLQHCGACSNTCSTQNTSMLACVAGVCTPNCNAGFGDCNQGASNDGCESPLNSIANCKACNTPCAADHAVTACAQGTCQIDHCVAGYDDCDKSLGNGCEINTDTSSGNCGGCGQACSTTHITPTCSDGNCGGVCTDNFLDCNGDKRIDGCEANTAADPNNCGSCGRVCSKNHITAHCSAGACDGLCESLFGDCNTNKDTDGCETPLSADVANCGTCGHVCSAVLRSGTSTGSSVCAAGACDVACNAGLTKCTVAAGEFACVSATDPQYCKQCTLHCAAGTNCVTSACVADSCALGLTDFINCISLKSNPSHCGFLMTSCSGTNDKCEEGVCRNACTGSHTQCQTTSGVPFCADLANDSANCGGCGILCNPGQVCAAGQCRQYLHASGCWECGLGNNFKQCCDNVYNKYTLCLDASGAGDAAIPCP